MPAITHHIPDNLLAAYAAGSLPEAFSLVVASHISMCQQCRADYESHQMAGGLVLEGTTEVSLSGDVKSNTLALLDQPFTPSPVYERRGVFPGPVNAVLEGRDPNWRRLGMGVKQSILSSDPEGSVRLLWIPPGQNVPDHGHNGLELTLVLQGSFSDETGRFSVGDVEVGDEDLEHTPVAGADEPCICLAATSAPLRFNTFVPRLLQPFFRI